MPPRIEIASTCSIIAVNGLQQAFPLGLVERLTLEKTYVVEGVTEIGSFQYAEVLTHGYGARFSWGRAITASQDLISMSLVPGDLTIPDYQPIFLRVIDQQAQRMIALIHKGVVETYTIELGSRTKLLSNVSGIACSLLSESELN